MAQLLYIWERINERTTQRGIFSIVTFHKTVTSKYDTLIRSDDPKLMISAAYRKTSFTMR